MTSPIPTVTSLTWICFHEVYAVYVKANARLVTLTSFCRDVYQMTGIREMWNMNQIKAYFYDSRNVEHGSN